MRHRTRSDDNQKAIDLALRSIGATVVSLGNVGSGVPDRLVGYRGKTYLMETKNKDTARGMSRARIKNSQLSDDQVRFHTAWRGKPIAIVFSVDEALASIGATLNQSSPVVE